MVNEELKPCPFCGGRAEVLTGVLEGMRVECRQCGGEGPKGQTPMGKVALWNLRHDTRPAAAAEQAAPVVDAEQATRDHLDYMAARAFFRTSAAHVGPELAESFAHIWTRDEDWPVSASWLGERALTAVWRAMGRPEACGASEAAPPSWRRGDCGWYDIKGRHTRTTVLDPDKNGEVVVHVKYDTGYVTTAAIPVAVLRDSIGRAGR